MVNPLLKIADKWPAKYTIMLVCFLLNGALAAKSQMTIYQVQDFNFGAFYQGSSGGSIDVSTAGSRSATGDIILMNSWNSGTQAIFDIEIPAGSIISISVPDAVLTGSNGGTLTLHIKNSDPVSPFNTTAVPPGRTRLQLGGTLTIGNRAASPPGNYQGTFSITFNHE